MEYISVYFISSNDYYYKTTEGDTQRNGHVCSVSNSKY
jgi:hypothetical protein